MMLYSLLVASRAPCSCGRLPLVHARRSSHVSGLGALAAVVTFNNAPTRNLALWLQADLSSPLHLLEVLPLRPRSRVNVAAAELSSSILLRAVLPLRPRAPLQSCIGTWSSGCYAIHLLSYTLHASSRVVTLQLLTVFSPRLCAPLQPCIGTWSLGRYCCCFSPDPVRRSTLARGSPTTISGQEAPPLRTLLLASLPQLLYEHISISFCCPPPTVKRVTRITLACSVLSVGHVYIQVMGASVDAAVQRSWGIRDTRGS